MVQRCETILYAFHNDLTNIPDFQILQIGKSPFSAGLAQSLNVQRRHILRSFKNPYQNIRYLIRRLAFASFYSMKTFAKPKGDRRGEKI
jgi:hypothetical protein